MIILCSLTGYECPNSLLSAPRTAFLMKAVTFPLFLRLGPILYTQFTITIHIMKGI